MTWAFVTYLTMKGLKHVWVNITDVLSFLPHTKKPTFGVAAVIGLIFGVAVYFIMVSKLKNEAILNTREGINRYFTVPLIFSAALLSFAHGANDVANAVGPLAAISDAVLSGGIASKSAIPFWVMAIGALGISIGLALYGPRLIKTVGDEITKIDPIRGFCVALAAAITVIIASQLGLPVSSTHIAVGAIFGVGFLREWLHLVEQKEDEIEKEIEEAEKRLKAYELELEDLQQKTDKSKDDYKRIVELIEVIEDLEKTLKRFKKILKKEEKVKYVKRDLFKKIIAAWLITVPVAAMLAAMIFFMIKGMML